MLHIVVHSIHVVYVARGVAATIFGEVARFSAVEAGSFGLRTVVVLLWFSGCCIVVSIILLLHVCGIGVGIVASILLAIVGCSGVGYVHRYWNIVVHQSWGISGIVGWPLLLRPHLLAVAPASWLELVPVLTERVIERSCVRLPRVFMVRLERVRVCDGNNRLFVQVAASWT
jgi:hypothetical protein